MICNDEGDEHDEVKDDDAADLKSPELVLVILVLALHVAIPVHQDLDHRIHLAKDDLEKVILPKMILMKTCPPPVLSTPSLLQVQSPDRTSRLHSVIIIVKSLIIHVEVEVEPEGAVGGGLVTVGSLHPVSTELQT